MHTVDHRRLDLFAAIGDDAVGRRHLEQRGFAGSQRIGQLVRNLVINAHALRQFADLVHAEIIGEPDRHHIARLFDAAPQGRGAIIFVGVVLRLPDLPVGHLELDRRVEDHRRRRVAIVERGRIDKRLEGGTRLAQRLHGTIELALAIGESADQRQDAAGMRIHGHQRTLDIGNLDEVIETGRLVRRDIDDVAHGQHVICLLDLRPEPGAVEIFARPRHQRDRHGAGFALSPDGARDKSLGLQSDLGTCLVHFKNDGEPPGIEIGRHLHLAEDLAPVTLDGHVLDGAAIAPLAIEGDEAARHRLAGIDLQLRIERGAHGQAAPHQLVFAIDLNQLAARLFGKRFGREELRAEGARIDFERLALRRVALDRGDVAVIVHFCEYPVAPFDGALGLPERMIVIGSLGQGREIGDLFERELVQRLAEIIERCRGNAIGVETKEYLIEIELDNLVLVEGLLDTMRQDRFLHLALDGAFIGEEEVLGHLLGDGGGADDLALAGELDFQIAQTGSGQTRPVEPLMLIEGLVFGRDESLYELLWNIVHWNEQAALVGIFGNQRAVDRMHARHHRRFIFSQLLVIGQALRHVPDHIAHAAGNAEKCNKSYREQPTQKSKHVAPEAAGKAQQYSLNLPLARFVPPAQFPIN